MRTTLLALTATAGLIGWGSATASAAPVTSLQTPQASAIQQADWYCGPRCQYWHHRRWEARHEWWRYHHPYYGYNGGYYQYYYR